MKAKQNRKWIIPHRLLKRQTLCFNSNKKRKLKIKLRRIRATENKKWAFFVPLFLFEGKFC